MPPPLSPIARAAIEDDIRAGKSRNAIAREHGVSGSTVTRLAKALADAGEAVSFDRSRTRVARAARREDLAARRTDLGHLLMDEAFDLVRRLHVDRPYVVRGRDGAQVVMSAPEPRDLRDLMTAVGIAVDKVGVLMPAEEDQVSRASTLMDQLIEGLREDRQTRDGV